MRFSLKTWMNVSCAMLALSTGALAQVKVDQPAPQTPKPGVQVQAPGVNVQTPGVNAQGPGVKVQAPGVQVQVPGAQVQAGANVQTYNGYYPQTPWFSDPSVREQLQMNDQQYNELNKGYQQAWNQYYQGWTGLNANLTAEQRAQREAELRANFDKSFNPTLTSVYTDPAAQQRYNQIYLQYQGYGAFQDPNVQQQLNLTAEQQQQLNQLGTAWNQQFYTWRTDYPANRERVGRAFRESRREARQRIHGILTPTQRTTWTTMTGPVYEFQPQVYFPAATTTTTLKPVVP